ncbi:PAS domain-containing protein [Geomonas nitrogeniifigens]|uniref:histidine kinase n=1 Tax=Geomonas diazotrophica TaxID=2843197 RepID=A0ABX8JG60_9BACT|nr:ATP-binding protein [Geomonas nitrogeniifigens]QWV97384.1 PAS domain-containing protein [Geomonas nitrogeniifigens]QXE86542.1 PAS domain-containing protein [Geomonas nitrogeniifigens]
MALQESDAGYRELFEENPEAMWVCHRDTGRFLAVNEAALRLYGYRRSQFLELDLARLGPIEPPTGGKDQVVSCLQRSQDGAELQLQLTWHPVTFQGEPAHLVLARRIEPGPEGPDQAVLRRQVAEQLAQLEAAHRELEAFSYSVSHDLRAPLRHIDGFSRALLDDYGEALGSQGQEYLTRICLATGKMAQLIDAVLQLVRAGRSELEPREVDLSVKAQVISLELKHKEPERRVEFEIAEGVRAEADPKLVRQLLEILIGNAWKFSSKTPEARIRFGQKEENGERIYFVSDNGAGFDMAYAEKLFTVFHRLHRADEFEGSGVGLAIAQRIVTRHGGRIWAESAPGQGATLYFTLGCKSVDN